MLAAQRGHTDIIKILTPYEMGFVDRNKWSALMCATVNNNFESAKLLVSECQMQNEDE